MATASETSYAYSRDSGDPPVDLDHGMRLLLDRGNMRPLIAVAATITGLLLATSPALVQPDLSADRKMINVQTWHRKVLRVACRQFRSHPDRSRRYQAVSLVERLARLCKVPPPLSCPLHFGHPQRSNPESSE